MTANATPEAPRFGRQTTREAERLTDALGALRRAIDNAETAVTAALAGEPLLRDDLVLPSQRVCDALTHGAALRALFETGGTA